MGVQSTYLADIFQPSIGRVHYQGGACSRLVTIKVVHDDGRIVAKRVFDLVGATVGLLLLWPVLLAIAIAIKLTSGGPAIFAQERYGFHKRRFRMYKFRTMIADAEDLQVKLEARNEADGPVFKIAEDPRVTPVGKLLRRTSLDELPQLWNVLMGDMSLAAEERNMCPT
jgi:lipopolysaccharide/colanic/teichoic acid biosynthesis glycosyltransferase